MSASFGTEENVNVHFVIPSNKNSENECTEDMKSAFQACLAHSLSTKWIPGEQCLKLYPVKTDVFVFEEFTGSPFGYLKSFHCFVIGPRCILDCLAADIVVPKCNFPLFTVAMRELVVTTTGFMEPRKSMLGEKIQYMGGTFSLECRQSVTHLVANRPGSAKYEKAVEYNIPVMSEQWVEAVWEESKKRNVHARDQEFQKYKCSVFHNLVITCSQILRKQKEQLKLDISSNGGIFCGELEAGRTNVLVVGKPFGDKFTHAALWKIPCVSLAWVMDSIAKGYALPFVNYAAAPNENTSTPERGVSAPLQDLSASCIQMSMCLVNETVAVDNTIVSRTSAPKDNTTPVKPLESPKKNKHVQLINKINVSDVKKAGIFLDGCNIYFSGFSPEYTEKLRRIINSGGATRFNEISDSVTHVIVGDFVQSDINILKTQGSRLHVVTVEWLVESISLHSAAPEDKFSCLDDLPSPVEFQSPLSKKGLLVLHTQKKKPVRTIDIDSPKNNSPKKPLMPKNLLEQYATVNKTCDDTRIEREHSDDGSQSNENITLKKDGSSITRFEQLDEQMYGTEIHTDSTQNSSATSTQETIFNGITFSLAGYPAVATTKIETLITSAGGKVVSKRFKGIPDYGVVPIHGATLFHTTTEIITHIWLEECIEEGIKMPVQYYHQPVNFVEDAKPLSGCVVTTTSYSGSELIFVQELMEGLGAVHQSMMARVNRPADNLLATTHLLCPDNTDLTASRKYKAACKWGIPCLSHHWLLSCASAKKRMDEGTFTIGRNSVDSPVVIARTPMVQGSKRKFCEDETTYKFLPSLKVPANEVESPSTPKCISRRDVATPVLKTPVQMSSGMKTPDNVTFVTPRAPGDIPTPETPYGQIFKENPSPKTRKMWKKWIDQWPEEPEFKPPPPRERRTSTPMAELIRRGWQKFATEPYMKIFHKGEEESGSQIEEVNEEPGPTHDRIPKDKQLEQQDSTPTAIPSPGAGINTQLQELNQILDSASKSSGRSGKESDNDNQSTPRAPPPVRHISQAPESLDLCTDLVEWVDPVMSNQQKPAPVFMLTSMDNREQYEEIIRSLGGIVSSSQIFEPTTTHLICQQPSRNEKILSSIAAGKWVLEKRYLEDSKKESHFLEEENYEWGNPKAAYLQNVCKKDSLSEQLAKATYRWRCKIQESGKGAFAGMKAIVCASQDKLELYKRLVVAGGGEVLKVSPPFSEPGNATVCILELSKVQHPVNLQALVDRKVPCVPPMFLNDFIINDPSPDVFDCLIPEYKALL